MAQLCLLNIDTNFLTMYYLTIFCIITWICLLIYHFINSLGPTEENLLHRWKLSGFLLGVPFVSIGVLYNILDISLELSVAAGVVTYLALQGVIGLESWEVTMAKWQKQQEGQYRFIDNGLQRRCSSLEKNTDVAGWHLTGSEDTISTASRVRSYSLSTASSDTSASDAAEPERDTGHVTSTKSVVICPECGVSLELVVGLPSKLESVNTAQ